MKIWIITEFFDSASDIVSGHYVKGLAEKLAITENVEVVFPSGNGCNGEHLNNAYKVSVIPRLRFSRKNLILRTPAQLLVSLQFFLFLLRRAKKRDMIVSFNHPPFFIFFSSLIKKLRGTKSIIVAYDLFPEILVATGVSKRNIFYDLSVKMFSNVYNNADKIFSLGNEMTSVIQTKIHNNLTQIYTIPNYADTDEIFFQPKEKNEIIRKYNLESKIVFSYAGTIGRCQGMEKLLNLIDNLSSKENVHFLFFGKGTMTKPFLEQIYENRNRHMITWAGFLVTGDRKSFLNACDVAIITLLEGMTGLNFPSKTYNIMASGHPILFVGDEKCELAKMITDHRIGWICNRSDRKSFESVIKEIIADPEEVRVRGKKARLVAERYFSKADILDKYYKAFFCDVN